MKPVRISAKAEKNIETTTIVILIITIKEIIKRVLIAHQLTCERPVISDVITLLESVS